MTLIVGMAGGPGCGKSTVAAGVFHELKMAGVNCEFVSEFAKDLVWERRFDTLGNQVYVLGKQHHRLRRLDGQVDVVVTDSSLALCGYYGTKVSQTFTDLVFELFRGMDNMTFVLLRPEVYAQTGRTQTREEAEKMDSEILALLALNNIDFHPVSANGLAGKAIASIVMDELKRRRVL